ncbi:MAG: hypothetical protein IM571_02200 [Chitinophagaceae bacterium]|jgi:hypothetical protein|nr:hypothetical protein [Chitinophagaceae bacterium]MCA6469115.1 hypothetical protein [Chitinophagaceae bacterium]MCA6476741.1 hypothetical protein [Chitinophagaceae bacterium]MCA6480240.1 hypothetical protein [Chitinophagaceae bacterium]MCA6492788.1 hypothetical protein [Chitinophagaceae bacterium]
MNLVKRYAGILWIALGPVAMYFLLRTAAAEIHEKPVADTWIQWGIFTLVALPIAAGMVFFGILALRGAYDHLPEESDAPGSGDR